MDLQAPLRGLRPGQFHRADAGLMQPPFPALLAQQPASQARLGSPGLSQALARHVLKHYC